MKRASLRDLPASFWSPSPIPRPIPRLLAEPYQSRTYLVCDAELTGRRIDAYYCSGKCRIAASKARRAA